jgi:hypothetical protein
MMESHCDRGGVSLYGSGDGRAEAKPAAGEIIWGCRGSMTSLSPAYVALSNRHRGTAQNTISPNNSPCTKQQKSKKVEPNHSAIREKVRVGI